MDNNERQNLTDDEIINEQDLEEEAAELKAQLGDRAFDAQKDGSAPSGDGESSDGAASSGDTFKRVYDDTTFFIDGITSEYTILNNILALMGQGKAQIELKKRYILRAIDEDWVRIVEDTLPALDAIIRNPSRFFEEKEEVVPIEFAKRITQKSLQHLAQHTDYISKVEGDMITPNKILNVYREETLQTYENKFVNTLINHLFAFVSRRYEIAKKIGQDEKTSSIEFKEEFEHKNSKVKMDFRIELAESAQEEEDRVERNYTFTTDLWRRVERLNSIVTQYANSDFVQNMGRSYIRPPVIRTNAILKNKNLRQCLELWMFIESYDNAGYSMLVQENLENVENEYLKNLYSTLAIQYLIFRHNIHNEFEADKTLASEITENVLNPRIIDNLRGVKEDEFDIPLEERKRPSPAAQKYASLTTEDLLMLDSLDIALEAAETIEKNNEHDYFSPGDIKDPEAPEEPETPEEPAAPEGAGAPEIPGEAGNEAAASAGAGEEEKKIKLPEKPPVRAPKKIDETTVIGQMLTDRRRSAKERLRQLRERQEEQRRRIRRD